MSSPDKQAIIEAEAPFLAEAGRSQSPTYQEDSLTSPVSIDTDNASKNPLNLTLGRKFTLKKRYDYTGANLVINRKSLN